MKPPMGVSVSRGRLASEYIGLAADVPVNGGAEGDRTPDLVIANDALSQLSYSPVHRMGAFKWRPLHCQATVAADRGHHGQMV